MEAATLVKVPDNIDRGVNALPAASSTPVSGCAKGNTDVGPAPTAAINSGKSLDSSLLSASNQVSNGQNKMYAAKENPELTTKGNGGTGTHASNE